MIITIDGIIYERVDTTANWNYVNPVLGFKEKGFEINNSVDKIPVGMKIGDGIHQWDDLPYWFTGISTVSYTIHAGWPTPYNIPKSIFSIIGSLRPGVRQVITGASATQDTNEGANQLCRYNFTDSSKTVLSSIDVVTTTSDGTTVDVDTYIVITP